MFVGSSRPDPLDLWAVALLALSLGIGIGYTFGMLTARRIRCYFRDWESENRRKIGSETPVAGRSGSSKPEKRD